MLEGTNDAPDAGETTREEPVETTSATQPDLREVLSQFKAEILSELKAKPEPQEPQVTVEMINEYWKTNPAKAIELALEKKLNEKITPVKQELFQTNRREYFDQKAEQEFPLLKTDKGFQKLVGEKMTKLISRDGMSKDSPSLLYLAAELAASQYKAKPGSSTRSEGISAEAPSNPGSRPKPASNPENSIKNYNALKRMFLGEGKEADESEKRFKEKLASGRWGGNHK